MGKQARWCADVNSRRVPLQTLRLRAENRVQRNLLARFATNGPGIAAEQLEWIFGLFTRQTRLWPLRKAAPVLGSRLPGGSQNSTVESFMRQVKGSGMDRNWSLSCSSGKQRS